MYINISQNEIDYLDARIEIYPDELDVDEELIDHVSAHATSNDIRALVSRWAIEDIFNEKDILEAAERISDKHKQNQSSGEITAERVAEHVNSLPDKQHQNAFILTVLKLSPAYTVYNFMTTASDILDRMFERETIESYDAADVLESKGE